LRDIARWYMSCPEKLRKGFDISLEDSCLRGQVVNMVESFNVTELDGNDGVVYTWELAVSLAGESQ
jgi:hypothetical protein